MKLTLLIALVLSTILPGMSEARTWHVEPDSTGQVINIQAGIDSASAGDTVLVAPGIYTGDGNWELDFKGKPIVVRSDGEATISALGYPYGTHYGFHFHSGEDSTSVLEGFHIEYLMFPQGILIDGSSPTIRNNSLSYSGISCENSRAIIENNRVFYCNTGIYCRKSRALIKNNLIRIERGMMDAGHGIQCDSDSSVIIINSIIGNTSGGGGICGGMYCEDSHNIIRGNFMDYGQGIRCSGGSYTISDNYIGFAEYGIGISCVSCNSVISNNHIEGSGWVGLTLDGGTHMISGNSIRGILYGSGVRFNSVDSNTVFTGNFVYLNGGTYGYDTSNGGVFCYHSSPIISDNVIAYNQVEYFICDRGGGIHCVYSSPHIIRNTIAYNITFFHGGGVHCIQSSPRIENCIIAYNGYSSEYNYGISCSGELSCPTIMNCNVYGNATGNYFGIPDQTGINGNFSIAPLFCDPENLEFTLHALSPCLPENNPYGPEYGLIGALGLGCDYIATLLQSFDAEYDDSSIEINWTVSDASDISDFDIYRASAPDWEFLAVNDPGLDGGGTSFTFHDRDISSGIAYKYRVLIFDEKAARVLFETDRIAVPAMPLALNQNYPNPFNPSTRITYQVPANDRVTLDVYDVSGRLVTRLVDDVQNSGSHAVDWNGTNSNGSDVSAGTYFYRLTSGKETISRKMVLLR